VQGLGVSSSLVNTSDRGYEQGMLIQSRQIGTDVGRTGLENGDVDAPPESAVDVLPWSN
jgi:hypothetical protein